MDCFNYHQSELFCEQVPVAEIAREVGTPTYIYSAQTFRDHYQRLAAAFAPLEPLICYAVKSCSNLAILKQLAALGAGLDVVSGGELFRAQKVGVPGTKIVYAGVGKTEREITEALNYQASGTDQPGIGLFNIESEAEFETVSRMARHLGKSCRATLRVNPDVDPKTHKYTTTGKKETKFGVDLERARRFFAKYGGDEWCRLTAIHLHIGSPVYTTEPYVEAVTRALELIDDLNASAGRGYPIDTLNIGGGFGADYESKQSPTAADYADALIPLLAERVRGGERGGRLRIILEPGRSIAANAGILLTRVQYLKQAGSKRFVIVDAGMHTLIRPVLYSAFHFIWPVSVAPNHVPAVRVAEMVLPGLERVDVVGPICESGDFLAEDRRLPPLTRDALIAVFSAGAYGMVMASRYNSSPLPAEVLVDGDVFRTIRRRETYADLIEHECDFDLNIECCSGR